MVFTTFCYLTHGVSGPNLADKDARPVQEDAFHMSADDDPIQAVREPSPQQSMQRLSRLEGLRWNQHRDLWVASSAACVEEVLTSNRCRVRPPHEPIPPALQGTTAGAIFANLARMCDGPGQVAKKRALALALASISTERVNLETKKWASALLAESMGRRDADWLATYAFALPSLVLGALIGFDAGDLTVLPDLARDFSRGISGNPTTVQIDRGCAAAETLWRRVHDLAAQAFPRGLFTSLQWELANLGVDDLDVTVSNTIGLFFQMYDSVAGLILSTILRTASSRKRPSDRERISAVIDRVVEREAPIQNTRRFASEDAMIGGQSVKRGDGILVVLASANRSETNLLNRRFSFGSGPHACPGSELAIAMAQSAVHALAERDLLPARLCEPVEFLDSTFARVPILNVTNLSSPHRSNDGGSL